MTLVCLFVGLLVVGGAIAAMTLRKLVHCALALAVSFGGLAAVYLLLNAQFIAFAQVLIYIGAVAILIVFAILLTRGANVGVGPLFSGGALYGVGIAVGVFGLLAGVVVRSGALPTPGQGVPEASVRQIGELLMTQYVLPLQVVGLLLTAALLGAVVLALREKQPPS